LHMLMMNRGYIYWDHIPSLCDRAIKRVAIEHKERLKRARVIKTRLATLRKKGRGAEARATAALREPDFAFENRIGEVVLAEPKGSSAKRHTQPRVKTPLASAVEQVSTWQSLIRPTPQKGYAVGTFWREVEDPIDSFVAVVDPDGIRGRDEPLPIP